MSPDNPTQILTPHDMSNLRNLQSVTTAATITTAQAAFGNSSSNNNNSNNLVFSTIPLDGHALLIQPQALISAAAIASSAQSQQHQRTIVTTANGLRTANITTSSSNNLSKLIATAAATKANNGAGNGNMPATSKYVFVQQNGNGQYTTNSGTNVGNIVLLATEPLDMNGGGEPHIITTTATGASGTDNDEDLQSLTWLSDKNLIKEIVANPSAPGTTPAGGTNLKAKRTLANSNSICIVNASGHDLIEELPAHIAGEEHVATSTNSSNGSSSSIQAELSDTQITTLSVSDFQQQFIANNKRFGSGTQLGTLANFALAQQEVGSSTTPTVLTTRKDDQQHIFGNIAAIGATTTVHVGPSGTTTVVEYKSNANFMPAQRQLLGNSAASNMLNSNATTITATNLSNSSYVPSASSMASSANHLSESVPTVVSVASLGTTTTSALPKQVTLCNTIIATTTTNGGNAHNNGGGVVNGNNTTNTIYQGQRQESGNNNGGNVVATTSTTHHPHKKYLREKMNVLDHGGGIGGGANGTSNIVVSSPASSNNSLSSSSTSSSTAAVNGGNSPISKFYTLSGNTTANSATALNCSNSSNSSSTAFTSAAMSPLSVANSPLSTSIPAYTIINPSQNVVSSSPAMSSPEPPTSKEYYMLATPTQHQQHNVMRSPTSYSSYENDSLKDFDVSNTNSSASGTRYNNNASTPQQHHNQLQQQQQHQTTPKSAGSSSAHSNVVTPQKQKHPNNVPYDPLVHTHNKPPYSFSSLIFMAIEGSTEKALPVKEIYAWIVQHFPYFKTAPTGWKNSVRHNLSLNKSFVKVEKAPNMGKGSLWRVEQQQRQNLIQALTRSPFFPNSAVDKIALKSPGGGSTNNNASYDSVDGGGGSGSPSAKMSAAHINPRFDPHLFPNLSKAFKGMGEHNVLSDVVPDVVDEETPSDYSTTNNNNSSTNSNNKYGYSPATQNGGGGGCSGPAVISNSIMGTFSNYENIERLARDCGADSIDDVNAATAMLALKHGPKVFSETFQNGAPVITSSPSEDHTYSAGGGSGAGSGASTPLTNGNNVMQAATNGNVANGQQNGCDNQSNCASSDAAYESSEENHNITPEELEDQQRHRDGVDALLSLSLSSVIDSTSCSPHKRPASTLIDDEHISARIENRLSPMSQQQPQHHHHVGSKMALHSNAVYPHHHQTHPTHHSILDEGYNTQGYYGSNVSNHHHSLHHLTSPSPPKKPKPLRSLRTKIKRKAWMR